MSDEVAGSVTQWIRSLKTGDHEAARRIWDRYFSSLLPIARARLRSADRSAEDEEDAALSAFACLCNGAALQKFPLLHDRQDLQMLLMVITARKAAKQSLHERRLKRGGGMVRSGFDPEVTSSIEDTVPENDPELAAIAAEELKSLFDRLGDERLRRVAELKLDGHSLDEIARLLGCARRTVARRLVLIRGIWLDEHA